LQRKKTTNWVKKEAMLYLNSTGYGGGYGKTKPNQEAVLYSRKTRGKERPGHMERFTPTYVNNPPGLGW
jgi:hypothetical protein